LQKLLDQFAGCALADLEALRQSLEDPEGLFNERSSEDAIARVLHNLRGRSANLGFSAMVRLTNTLQGKVSTETLTTISELIEKSMTAWIHHCREAGYNLIDRPPEG
jgi:HPt (histidine-containing phosphotransfer) domain-containing protein